MDVIVPTRCCPPPSLSAAGAMSPVSTKIIPSLLALDTYVAGPYDAIRLGAIRAGFPHEKQACSSGGERYLDTVEVGGSKPPMPTTERKNEADYAKDENK